MGPFDDLFDFDHDGKLDAYEKGAKFGFISQAFGSEDDDDDDNYDDYSENSDDE